MHLFEKSIQSWADWGQVYTDLAAFAPLVNAIYDREGLPRPARLSGLTPGTNAVFRADDTVVKIFHPEEAGADASADFETERTMLAFAQRAGIPTSTLLAAGEVEDRYRFRYMILSHVEGIEAGTALNSMHGEARSAFAAQMRALTDALHRPEELLAPVDLIARARGNARLQRLPGPLRADMVRRAERCRWRRTVITHGDITGENVLLGGDGQPVLIDFADSTAGPWWYELPPLVFELFRCDRGMVRAYLGAGDLAEFVRRVADGLSLHDFGANILADFAGREGREIPSLAALEEMLLSRWA